MKVKKLIAILSKLDPEFDVVMSKDGEGNNFSPLSDTGTALYKPDTTWSGEIITTDELEGDEELNAVVLWPTN